MQATYRNKVRKVFLTQEPIKQITFDWAETTVIKEGTKVYSFAGADTVINKIARNEVGNIGYCKTGITVEWLDGKTYTARIDITSKTLGIKDVLGKEILSEINFTLGELKPASWTTEQYQNYLETDCTKVDKNELLNLKNNYQLLEYTDEQLENVGKWHYELQEQAYQLQQSKPIINANKSYECVLISLDSTVGEWVTTLNGEQLQKEIKKHNVTEIISAYEVTPAKVETVVTESVSEITYKLNDEKNGVEIYFTTKPSEQVRDSLKVSGFKWSRFNKCWYAKQSDATLTLAQDLANGNQIETIDMSEIELSEFTDITQYVVNEETEKRLLSVSLFGDMRKVGYETQQLQNTLLDLLERTKSATELTDNVYQQNKLIDGFNSFCERYTREMNSYLNQKSLNPSWAVTGRGGMNVSRYNKKQDQLHNKLVKVIEMLEKQQSIISKYAYKFKRETA